jgi:hypothetical protein
MKKTPRTLVATLLFALAATMFAQSAPTPTETQEANLKAYVAMLRQDLKKTKVAILTELMQMLPDESAKFWPAYNEYDKELTQLGDQRTALIRMYAENLGSLSDEKVTQIATGLLDFEARRNQLKRQYFQRMSQTVSVKQAARFLQIENQIEKLVDLQISSNLPVVE